MIRLGIAVALVLSTCSLFAEEKEPALAEARARFDKADRELNQAWAQFKKTIPGDVFAMAKEKQREWIEFRDNQALAATHQTDEAQAKRLAPYYITAAALTETRAAWFQQLTAKKDESMTGSWLDGSGGEIEIVEQKGRLLFDLNVARTHGNPKMGNTNLGSLAGVAAWNSSIGWFSDKGRDPAKTDETNISFVLREPQQLQITEANARYYQGKGVSFDGVYYKVLPLSDEQQAAVIKAAESGKPNE